jgi:hypothetical protein
VSEELERLQKMTMHTIYGHDKSYKCILEENQIQTLKERREEMFEKFCLKLEKNQRYNDWLPKQTFTHYDLRKELVYEEKFARTARLYNSPLYSVRRKLNEISEVQFDGAATPTEPV